MCANVQKADWFSTKSARESPIFAQDYCQPTLAHPSNNLLSDDDDRINCCALSISYNIFLGRAEQ